MLRQFAALALLQSLVLPTAAHAIHPIHSSEIKWLNCSQNVPIAFELNSVVIPPSILANLPPSLYCGEIEVPMDYRAPFCAENKITVSLAMLRPHKPKGVIF
jgi:hypothetical protein